MHKILKPTTIIPPSLYVRRAADRQLSDIVDAMGRPGYVLVARQMGKTNLLLNMKRERASDLVLYFDLSTRMDSARAWFRRIIDGLVEACPECFDGMEQKISDLRSGSDVPPSAEYDRHLRMLLRQTPERVVVVLDEIDSLVSASYSDAILAQIRSMYFSRANHPEYERLTYVLSGVAEPSDLIKDKDISPFNIGEKIYLEDFTRAEFDEFCGRAMLGFSEDVSDQIFSWTRGNPRMTWDVCSELEDRKLSGQVLTRQIVDEVVSKLYLESFNRAPIDHIRTLVESDAQIRGAIVSLRYGKSDALDDKVKSRLYLAGITRAISAGKLEIKNKVIDLALSDRWMAQLDAARRSRLASASESFSLGFYEDAIAKFEAILADPLQSEEFSFSHQLELGFAYFYASESAKAIATLKGCLGRTKDLSLIQRLNFYIGSALLNEHAFEEGMERLEVAADGPNPELSLQARGTMVSGYLSRGREYASYALAVNERFLAGARESASNHLLASALYNQASIHLILDQKAQAATVLSDALQIAPVELQPSFLLLLRDLERDRSKRVELATRVASTILGNALSPTTKRINTLELTRHTLALTLAHLLRDGAEDRASELFAYILHRVNKGSKPAFDTLLSLFDELDGEEARRTGIVLVEHAVQKHLESMQLGVSLLRAYRSLAVYANTDDWVRKYLEELRSSVLPTALDDDDLIALTHLASVLLQSGAYPLASQLFEVYSRYAPSVQSAYRTEHLLLFFHKMLMYSRTGAIEAAREVAGSILRLTDDGGWQERGGSLVALIPEIRKQAVSTLNRRQTLVNPFRRYGRNQKVLVQYGNAAPIEKKFKLVESDLRSGKCRIVDHMAREQP